MGTHPAATEIEDTRDACLEVVEAIERFWTVLRTPGGEIGAPEPRKLGRPPKSCRSHSRSSLHRSDSEVTQGTTAYGALCEAGFYEWSLDPAALEVMNTAVEAAALLEDHVANFIATAAGRPWPSIAAPEVVSPVFERWFSRDGKTVRTFHEKACIHGFLAERFIHHYCHPFPLDGFTPDETRVAFLDDAEFILDPFDPDEVRFGVIDEATRAIAALHGSLPSPTPVAAVVAASADTTDDKPKKHPRSPDVRDLVAKLANEYGRGKDDIQIAREFVGGSGSESERKARNLLRQARRYPHLWKTER